MANPIFTKPLQLGEVTLSHPVIMAPLTRMRATPPPSLAPHELNVKYYEQRATPGGLLIGEASQISQQGAGYPLTPGIYTEEQTAGWKSVTEAVHAKKGLMYLQLWHVGRISHPSHQPDGALPVAPSAIAPKDVAGFSADFQEIAHPVPHELSTDEVTRVIEDYVSAAKNAKAAGFDGIELHSANGYLLDQFINENSNKRTDKYGGSIENRCRLTLEVLAALSTVFEPGRVGVRFSPASQFNDMNESNPKEVFTYLVSEADKMGLSYIHTVDPRIVGNDAGGEDKYGLAAPYWRSVATNTALLCAGGLTADSAASYLSDGDADGVVFGRQFISNPDLPYRLINGLELTPYDRSTFYGGDEKGYTDYPYHNNDPSNNQKLFDAIAAST